MLSPVWIIELSMLSAMTFRFPVSRPLGLSSLVSATASTASVSSDPFWLWFSPLIVVLGRHQLTVIACIQRTSGHASSHGDISVSNDGRATKLNWE